MIRILAATLALASATPALAETPLFSIGFGADVVEAHAGDILSAEPGFDSNAQPVLSIKLAPRFDALVAQMTRRNIGAQGALKVCGTVVLEPVLQMQITTADFQLAGLDAEQATRLAALIHTGSCGVSPSG